MASAMFKARATPKNRNTRRRPDAEDVRGDDDEDKRTAEEEAEEMSITAEKLAEVRMIQKLSRRQRGVLPVPVVQKGKGDSDEEDQDEWGLLDTTFAGAAGKKEVDTHLEAYLNERLYEKKSDGSSEEKKVKTREDMLYDIPSELQVNDVTEGQADKMSWVAGLAEVPLGMEYKLANIEATERAKREFLHGETGGRTSKGPALEPDAVTRKAFGSRFLHVREREKDSKSATDDAVLERFRKRMRR